MDPPIISSENDFFGIRERSRSRQKDTRPSDFLYQRAIGDTKSLLGTRRQYVNFAPQTTLFEQETLDYIKKFSLSGKYLIGFGRSGHSVVIHNVTYTSQPPEGLSFADFFPIHQEIIVCAGNETLCREFCLFTPDDRFMILASAAQSNNSVNLNLPLDQQASNGNPYSLASMGHTDNVRFHLVNMDTGKILDRIKFTRDYIVLSHHAGVSMFGWNFAVMSLQHQLIRVYCIDPTEGKLKEETVVGYKLEIIDPPFVQMIPPESRCIIGFKQRLLSFLYRRALRDENPRNAIRILYDNWNVLENLCMTRFQFLDSDTLLIKLVCSEALFVRTRGPSDNSIQSTAFFVFYSLKTTEILDFYRSSSAQLFEKLVSEPNFTDVRCQINENNLECLPCPFNDLYECQIWDRNFQLLAASRSVEGESYASKRLLQSLPYAPQSYSESPFLDARIFRYDERAISAVERQRPTNDFPIRFYSRVSDRVIFKMNSGSDPTLAHHSNPYKLKKHSQWIFHPYLPLVISFQYTLTRSVTINVHYHSVAPPPYL